MGGQRRQKQKLEESCSANREGGLARAGARPRARTRARARARLPGVRPDGVSCRLS